MNAQDLDLKLTTESAELERRLTDFDELYDKHVVFVWRTLRGLGLSEADAEDATQEVFLTVYKKLGSFEGRSSLRTWLCGIAIGIARNHTRKTGRRARADDRLSLETQPPASERAEALDLVWRCLRQLDEPLRLVFVLAELEKLTAPEIAEALTVNVNTVYSRIRLARERFEAAVLREEGVAR